MPNTHTFCFLVCLLVWRDELLRHIGPWCDQGACFIFPSRLPKSTQYTHTSCLLVCLSCRERYIASAYSTLWRSCCDQGTWLRHVTSNRFGRLMRNRCNAYVHVSAIHKVTDIMDKSGMLRGPPNGNKELHAVWQYPRPHPKHSLLHRLHGEVRYYRTNE